MKILSLYCGAGGLDEGLKQAGYKTTLAIDHWKPACETWKLNHEGECLNADIDQTLIDSLGKFDLVVGSPPCPEFSRAKHNRSFDLGHVLNYARALAVTQPKYHLMENVQDLGQVWVAKNYLINCADYGTPQTRLRRFFTNLPLPPPTHSKDGNQTLDGPPLKPWVSVRDALGLDGIIEDRKTTYAEPWFREYSTAKPSNTLVTDSRQWYISNSGHGTQNRVYITRPIEQPADTVVVAAEMRFTDYPIKSRKKIRNRTLRQTESRHNKGTLRKLTINEIATLQGFPPDYAFTGGALKKQIGNAVPSQPIKAFFAQPLQWS